MSIDEFSLALDLYKKTESLCWTALAYCKDGSSPSLNNFDLLNYNDNVDKILSPFDLMHMNTENPIGTTLIEFLNYNFDDFKDYLVFYSRYYGKYFENLSDDEFMELIDTDKVSLLSNKNLLKYAEISYKKEKKQIKKIQQIFIKAVEFIYNNNNRKDIKSLNFKQRFYILQTLNHDFTSLSLDLNYKNNFLFYYSENIFGNTLPKEQTLIAAIKKADPKGNTIRIANMFESKNIFSIIYIILYNMTFISDLYIKKCKNCNKYFLTNKTNTVYCQNIFSDNKTCREIGNALTQQKKQDNNPVYAKYRSIFAKKAMNVKRNADLPELKNKYEKWKKQAQKFWKDVTAKKKTAEEFDKWLEKNK